MSPGCWAETPFIAGLACDRYGAPLPGDPERWSFPTPARLAATGEETLRAEARLGYRAPYVLALARDITEREKFNEAMRLYNERLEELVEERTSQLRYSMEQTGAILENSSDAIALAASNGDITTSNPAFRQLVGSRVESAIEEILHLVLYPEHMEAMTNALFNVLNGGASSRVEVRIENQQGEVVDVDIALTSVNDPDGEMAGVVLSLRDITHLKEIERFKTRFVANAAHDLANGHERSRRERQVIEKPAL
mgnify:CR=1 FL=1